MYSDAVKELVTIWARVLDNIRDSGLDRHIYDTFFASTQLYAIHDNNFIIVTETNFVKENFDRIYTNEVKDAIHKATQSDYGFVIKTRAEIEQQNGAAPVVTKTFFEDSKINPGLTFDNFVVGPFNQEAYQASLIISDNPGKMYNPLFIYSDSGLGKTHLLHAIGNFVNHKFPKMNVLYVTANDFIEEYIKFVKNQKGDSSLKDFFRGVDVFLVDDVQLIAGKTETEAMFFTIFNSLVKNDPNYDKQVVLTSDRSPMELKGIEARLVTRFQSGLTVNIGRPDLESAKNILKKKIQSSNLDLNRFDDEVLTLYAEKFSSSIRELEGALNRLIFFTINNKSTDQITLEVGLESLGALGKRLDAKSKLDANKVLATVSDYYNISQSQLTGKSRLGQITIARHVAMFLMRTLLDIPLTKIGSYFSDVHHTTVMNGVEKVDKMCKNDIATKDAISTLKKQLRL